MRRIFVLHAAAMMVVDVVSLLVSRPRPIKVDQWREQWSDGYVAQSVESVSGTRRTEAIAAS